MCDFRSRTAPNLALDCCFLVLFAALRARGRPEIDFDYLFKAKKVTLREYSANRESPGRQMAEITFIFLRGNLCFYVFSMQSQKCKTHIFVIMF